METNPVPIEESESESALQTLQTQLKAERAKSSTLSDELFRARSETARLARLIEEEEEAIANRLLRRNAELLARGAAVQQSLEAESENVANLLSRQLLNVQREKSAMEKAVQEERSRISTLEARLSSAQRDKEEALLQASGAAASLRLVVHSSHEALKRELVEAERRSEAETEAVVLRLQRQLSYLWASTQSAEAQAKSVHEGWMRLVQSFLDKFPPTPTLPLPPSTSSSSSAPPPQTQLLNYPEGNEQKIISLQSSSSSSSLFSFSSPISANTLKSIDSASNAQLQHFKTLEEAFDSLRSDFSRASISLAPSFASPSLSIPQSPNSNSGALSPGSPFPRLGSSRGGGGGGGGGGGRSGQFQQQYLVSSALSSASSRASSVGPNSRSVAASSPSTITGVSSISTALFPPPTPSSPDPYFSRSHHFTINPSSMASRLHSSLTLKSSLGDEEDDELSLHIRRQRNRSISSASEQRFRSLSEVEADFAHRSESGSATSTSTSVSATNKLDPAN